MAKTKSLEETPVVFGADENAGAVLEDTQSGSETVTPPATDETPSTDTDSSETTAVEGGYSQAPKLTPTTVVETGTIPQTDTSEFAYHVRHIMNGDIQDEDGKSLVADKMVNEAHIFQLHKSVVNSFPETGAEYLATLDFKVNQ